MVFSRGDKIFIKNLVLLKGYRSRRLIKEFPQKGWNKNGIDLLLRTRPTFNRSLMVSVAHGRKPRGTGGTVPPKFEVGDGPCIRPPNISRSSVIGCVLKYERGKKRCHEIIFCSEIEVFRKEKDHNFI